MERPPRQRIWEEDYSRLTASVGVDALRRFQGAALLVVGMTGLGVEVGVCEMRHFFSFALLLVFYHLSFVSRQPRTLQSWEQASSQFMTTNSFPGMTFPRMY